MENKKIIDKKTVSHVARLARLGLSDRDIEKFSKQLSGIVQYIDKLNEVNTGSTEPMRHAISGVKDVFRDDKPKVSLSVEQATTNAPKRIKDFFAVPKILE